MSKNSKNIFVIGGVITGGINNKKNFIPTELPNSIETKEGTPNSPEPDSNSIGVKGTPSGKKPQRDKIPLETLLKYLVIFLIAIAALAFCPKIIPEIIKAIC